MKRTLFVLLALMLGSPYVLAECPPDCPPAEDSTQFNPASPGSFDYANGDYSTITDWSKVEWSRIPPAKIAEVPAQEIKYVELTLEQRLEMTSDQIGENFDSIEDLTKDVKKERAEEAVKQKYNLMSIDLGKGANLKQGMLKATYGEQGYVPLTSLSPRVKIIADQDGRINIHGESNPPSIGKYTAVYEQNTIIKTTAGEAKVQGSIDFVEGQTYLRGTRDEGYLSSKSVKINGIKIHPPYKITQTGVIKNEVVIDGEKGWTETRQYSFEFGNVRLFFDGEKHDGDYVSISDNRIDFSLVNQKEREMSLVIPPSHPILDNDQKFSPLVLGIYDGSYGSITKRGTDSKGRQLTPLMNLVVPAVGKGIKVDPGLGKIFISDGKVVLPSVESSQGTIPITIIGVDSMGNDIISNEVEPHKLVVTTNTIFVLPQSHPAEDFECKQCYPKEEQVRLMVDYSSSTLKKYGIKLEGSAAQDPIVVSQIATMVKQLPPKVRESLKWIQVNKRGDTSFFTCGLSEVCANREGIVITPDVGYGTFFHEASHTRHLQVYDEDAIKVMEAARTIADTERNNLGFEGTSVESSSLQSIQQNTFKARWFNARKESFQEHGGSASWSLLGYDLRTSTWEDGSNDPRGGYMNAYGSSDHTTGGINHGWFEDIATSTEASAGSLEVYTQLVNPQSSFYAEKIGKPIFENSGIIMDQRMAQDWATRYRGKLDLLEEYGFITTRDYCKIVQNERCKQ